MLLLLWSLTIIALLYHYSPVGYKSRDILAMALCYSSSVVYDRRFVKFVDSQSTCAFHYLHNGCNLLKKNPPITTRPDDVAEVDFGYVCVTFSNTGYSFCMLLTTSSICT